MTKCFGTNVYYIPCLATQCLLGLYQDKAINWPRHMPLNFGGHVLILLGAKGRHMRPCPLSSSVMVCLQPWSPTTPKNRPKGISYAKLRRLTATLEWLNPTSHGSKPLKAASMNSNRDLHIKWSRLDNPSPCGTIGFSSKHMSALVPAMTSMWSQAKCQRPLWQAITPTSATSLSLAGMTGLCFVTMNPLTLTTSWYWATI